MNRSTSARPGRPRLVLHIGMPKTGSSALQEAMHQAREALLAAGVLYPAEQSHSHNILLAGCSAPGALPRGLAHRFREDPDSPERAFAAWWAGVLAAIAEARPAVVVLSAENLFATLENGRERLVTLLREHFDDIGVVAYVRRPSSYYLSSIQQKLRGAWRLPPPSAVRIRPAIESYAAVFPLSVTAYDPRQLRDGDIVADFVDRFLPEASAILPGPHPFRVNQSMSAEAMALLQGYRRSEMPDQEDVFTPQATLVANRLIEASTLCEAPRPRLFDEIAASIDSRSVDLLWLRDTYGVAFPEIDYGGIDAAAPAFRIKGPVTVAELCPLDADVQNRVLQKALKLIADTAVANRASGQQRSLPGLAGRVLQRLRNPLHGTRAGRH